MEEIQGKRHNLYVRTERPNVLFNEIPASVSERR
jgi:hypothetical protein